MVLMDVGAYRKSAELHELFMAEPWARLAPTIRSALPSLRPDAALVDVGAGSGMGLVSVCPGLPGSVYAVEPDDTMRTALIARLAALPELRDRTTVLPVTIEEAVHLLPRSWDALWCAHTLGHLGREERNVLWRALGERLTAQGVAVLTVAADHDPAAVPTEEEEEVTETVRLGDHTVLATHRSLDQDTGCTTYTVLDSDGRQVRSVEALWSFGTVTADMVQQEAAPHGLAPDRLDERVVRLVRVPA